jgi:hypothetical protein
VECFVGGAPLTTLRSREDQTSAIFGLRCAQRGEDMAASKPSRREVLAPSLLPTFCSSSPPRPLLALSLVLARWCSSFSPSCPRLSISAFLSVFSSSPSTCFPLNAEMLLHLVGSFFEWPLVSRQELFWARSYLPWLRSLIWSRTSLVKIGIGADTLFPRLQICRLFSCLRRAQNLAQRRQ